MSSKDIAVSVRGLSKAYSIVHNAPKHTMVGEALLHRLKNPFQRVEKETFWALKDVEFDIQKGEVVGIIGRNGAGKSTLLKILSRITKPTTGQIDLYGRVGSLLEVGTGFHPELTGRENIFLNGAILGMRKREIERQFDAIVDFAEVEQFLDTPVKRYSSGMYVRLAFAVAAHLNPEILIVDEVLAVGDSEFQKKCMGKMQDVSKNGRTVLFVSHNMNAVEQLCSSILLLEEGQVKCHGKDVRPAIMAYLGHQENAAEPTEWINTGNQYQNPYFKPLRLLISDGNGQTQKNPVSNNDEMWIHIEAEIQEIDPALTVGYAIYSSQGSLLYWSYQTDAHREFWPKLSRGICTLQSRIPKRFLNEGTYKIELAGGLHFRQWLFEPGVQTPAVYLTIQGGLSDSAYWMSKRPGLLAPSLHWELVS